MPVAFSAISAAPGTFCQLPPAKTGIKYQWHIPCSTGPRMNVSLYLATAAMNAGTLWQEVIAENLAGFSIAGGARKQKNSFSAIPAGKPPGIASLSGGNYVLHSASPFRQALPTLRFLQMAS